ncbi:MAG: hypothetical protein IT326_01215 [Anaerolineae bacterium]|nr:hypothetical protein [Anaerolineae bacterium]
MAHPYQPDRRRRVSICPACGAVWPAGAACREAFHQMLYWEAERPELGAVHHLMVLCFHLQHPALYSPEGLEEAKRLLIAFVRAGASPEAVRRDAARAVDSGRRSYSITARPDAEGRYARPAAWQMTTADVIAGGIGQYTTQVEAWARAICDTLSESGNL